MSKQYSTTISWSRALHRWFPAADGIRYASRHAGAAFANVCLFLDRCRDALTVELRGTLGDAHLRPLMLDAADRYRLAVLIPPSLALLKPEQRVVRGPRQSALDNYHSVPPWGTEHRFSPVVESTTVRQLADSVWQLSGFPRNALNVYVLEDVLIDAGTFFDRGRILKQLAGRTLNAHALTHAHFDHYGSSRFVCERFGIPLWCGADDVEMVQAGKMIGPGGRVIPAAPSCHVTRGLREGDEVADFKVLDTPGHSPGHVCYWREPDRVLVCGDVIWGCNPFINAGPPREPYPFLSPDPVRNRESARRVAALELALVCFGHGAPLRDTARFAEVVSRLAH